MTRKSELQLPLPFPYEYRRILNISRAARYDFDNLDTVPEDALVVFSVATYGEGEPTDNAVALMDFLKEDPQFTNGSTLENLHYVIFGRASAMGKPHLLQVAALD